MRLKFLPALLLLLLPSLAASADLINIKVEKKGKRYYVQSESVYYASRPALFHVLLDYENFDKVSSVFTESYFLEPADDGAPRGFTRVSGCVLFFCTQIDRVDRLYVDEFESIVAKTEPENSDFKHSVGRWRFEGDESATRIHYEFEMEPGFWVPPIIGPYFLKKRLYEGAGDAMQRVEALAQAWDLKNELKASAAP